MSQNEEHYRDLVENSLDLMCTHDLNGVLLTVNLAAARALGYEPSELVSRNLRELLSPEVRAELDAYLALISEKRGARGFMRLRTKSGETRIWEYTNTLRTEDVPVPFVRGMAHDVTEILQTQKALRKTAERLRVAAEVGRMYAWEWDPATDTVWRSTECVGILGLQDASRPSLARDYFSLVHPDDRARLWSLAKSLTPQDPVYRTVYRRFRPDGVLLWLEESGRATFDQAGKMIRLIGMTADVTERKQTEEKLRASEERYRRIVEATNEGIWLLDVNFNTSFVNRQMAGMLGCEPEEMLGRSVFDFYFPEDVEYKRQVLARRQEKVSEHLDERLRRKDGSQLWVRMAAIPICKDNGDFDGAMAIMSDITDRRLAEEALRESEQRFRLVANTAPVMIWMSDLEKLCNYANQPTIEFIGLPAEAILGNGWTERIHPDDLERSWDTYCKAFDQREPFRMEYRLRRYDEEYRWIIDSGVPRFNADGSFAGYIGSAIDATEQKLAADALSTISQRLIEAQEEERSWIARELHDDIGQRLTVLAWNLSCLEQRPPVSAEQLKQKLDEVSKQIADLGVDIQALSHRLHSPKLEHLGLAAAAASLCEELSERQNVEIQFHSENVPKDLPIEAALCLFRVLQEALQNAIKHSRSRHFEASLIGAPNQIDLSVRDSGSGFDPAEAMKGRGLGLTSIRERLKLVCGELSIESQLRKGTTIHARVPVGPKAIAVGAAR